MLFGVDGTGDSDIATYDKETAKSHVRTICNETPQRKVYVRGPDWKGFGERMTKPEILAEQIRVELQMHPNEKLYLTGFSRGAAIVVNTAAILGDLGIPVEAMFLFDAVDRSIVIDRADVVPANVKNCYHAVRAPEAESRKSFGNCALRAAAGVNFQMRHFFTTHGAMGGTPFGEKGLVPDPSKKISDSLKAVENAARSGLRKIPGLNKVIDAPQPNQPVQFIYEGAPELAATKVTVRQELIGMEQARFWMWDWLRKHGVLV